jgi:pimeloyl-ACP methyl ester carboxylesterase
MRVTVDGARLFTDFEGAKLRPDGPWLREVPTVVIVHTGPGTDHTPYKEHIGPALGGSVQVVYVDLRGCGRSDVSTPQHWNVEQWSSDLRALFARLGIERPAMLGAGWGSYPVLRFAQRWPDELSKLVLANPVARTVVPRIVAKFDELGGGAAGEAAHAWFASPSERTVAEYMRACFHLVVSPQYATALLLNPIWNWNLAVHWTDTEGRTIDLRPGLSSISAPTLIVAGTNDPQAPVASIEEVVAGLPGAQVEWFDGARHSVFRDAPECLDVIREFVA